MLGLVVHKSLVRLAGTSSSPVSPFSIHKQDFHLVTVYEGHCLAPWGDLHAQGVSCSL